MKTNSNSLLFYSDFVPIKNALYNELLLSNLIITIYTPLLTNLNYLYIKNALFYPHSTRMNDLYIISDFFISLFVNFEN